MRKIITIDGLASTGKTSAAKLLAERLDYVHFNSGGIYRAVGKLCLERGVDPNDEQAVLALLSESSIEPQPPESEGPMRIFVDGEDYTNQLSRPEVSEATSQSAKHPVVRERLLDLQREVFPGRNLVAEGRDMGTVVFPDADLKVFLEVRPEVKLERRMGQLCQESSAEEDLESLRGQMKIEIEDRDNRDQNRAVSPTVPASDASILDNSSDNLTSLVEKMYNLALSRGLAST